MYDELVKRLKEDKSWVEQGTTQTEHEIAEHIQQAADAIEELAAFKVQITDGHFYCMRDGVLYEAKVEPPKGKVFQLPPIEFAEEGE